MVGPKCRTLETGVLILTPTLPQVYATNALWLRLKKGFGFG